MYPKIMLFGAGHMGTALLDGIFTARLFTPDQVVVVDKQKTALEKVQNKYPSIKVSQEPKDFAEAAIVAVKPLEVSSVFLSIKELKIPRVVSIAAGVSLSKLLNWVDPSSTVVIRAMPNTAALIGQSASAISYMSGTDELDIVWAEEILSKVGTVIRVPEYLLDAVTALSGSGPAYFFLVVEALIEAGVLVGLPREVSEQLTRQTFLGAAELFNTSNHSVQELRHGVTSPGGTTAAALKVLESNGLRGAFFEAIEAATQRSIELRD